MADYKKVIEIDVDTRSAQTNVTKLLSSLEKDATDLRNTFKKIPQSFTEEFAESIKTIQADAEALIKLKNTIEAKKSLKLSTDIDEASLAKVKDKLASSDIGKAFLMNLVSTDATPTKNASNIESKKEQSAFAKDLEMIKKRYSPLERYKENGRYETVLGATVGKFANAMTNAIDSIGKFFVVTFKESFAQLAKMATYDASSTLISNTAARQQQLIFGLSGAQNYAMTNAMNILGMRSIEDLMWMNAPQAEQYAKLTATLEAQYSKLESSGIFETVQQFQIDMALMKLQFQNTVYQFIAAHRSQLEKVLEVALNFMSGVLEFLGWIVDGLANIFGNNYAATDTLASASNTISNTSTDNSKVINATINYTNNQSNDAQSAAISESALNQIIAALND